MSKDETNRVNAYLTTESDSSQDPLKRLHDTLSDVRNDTWIGPPIDLRENVLKAFRDQRQRQAPAQGPRREWLSWLGASLAPRTRRVMAPAMTLILLVMVGAVLAALQGQDDFLTARVDHVSGVVALNSSGNETWLPVQAGMELQAGDRLRSGNDAMVVLRFPDDSISELGANSQLSILQLATSQSGDGQIAVLHQYEGQTVHRVKPQNPEHSWFEVESSSASVTVIGTEFALEVTDFQASIVTVAKGVVEVSGQGVVLQVEAGQTASVLPGSEPEFGLPATTPIPTCVQDTNIIEPPVCDDGVQNGDMASPSPGQLLNQESSLGQDTATADIDATATSRGQLTPSPTTTPIKSLALTPTPAAGTPEFPTMTLPSETPTEEGSAPYEPTTTPTRPSSPPPTATPYNPPATATPVQPTALPPSSTPLPTALPPTSTPFPTAPPPTSTSPPTSPPPTSTSPPPPTSTPLPPTPTNIPPTATPPPPTPTPPPYP